MTSYLDAWRDLPRPQFFMLLVLAVAVGLARNGYDRLVHFAFGLLWVPPFSEAMRRHAGMGLRSSLWMALLFVGTASALYEIFEWMLTILLAPDMADEYNGQQGDMWDAQKDMAAAITGAMIAALWHGRKSKRTG